MSRSLEPSRRPRNSMTIAVAVVAVIVVLGLVVMVGWLSSRTGAQTTTANPLSAPLELPETAGEFVRDPNATPSPATMTVQGTEAQSVTSTYYEESTKSLIVMAVRPVGQSTDLVSELDITAVRDVGDGLCGRYPTGQDVCVIRADNIGLIGVGLDGQTLEDTVTDLQVVGQAMLSQ